MLNVFRKLGIRTLPQKINFGRFDINTTEKQKMIKAILANSDNCGDTICGDPKLVKNIINNDNNIKSYNLSHKGNPELCCQFYNFHKCNDCHMYN